MYLIFNYIPYLMFNLRDKIFTNITNYGDICENIIVNFPQL